MPQNSRVMIFRFSGKTQWQMFLLLYGRHVGAPLGRAPTWRLHTTLYTFRCNCLPNNAAMSNRIDLNLDDVFSLSTIYHIPDAWMKFMGCVTLRSNLPKFKMISAQHSSNNGKNYWMVAIFIFHASHQLKIQAASDCFVQFSSVLKSTE